MVESYDTINKIKYQLPVSISLNVLNVSPDKGCLQT